MREHRRFALKVTVALVVALMGGVGAASAGLKEVQHCISPSGTDLNEFWGVAEPVVADFGVPGLCTQIGSGRPWRVAQGWFMSPTFEAAPEGFEPAGATPLQDLLAKFEQVRYVVDPGTAQEKTYIVAGIEGLSPRFAGGLVAVNPMTAGVLKPVSVGTHVVEAHWTLTAMHCDGLGDVEEENCLPEGEFPFVTFSFEVTPGHD